jgi:hypothetical protein
MRRYVALLLAAGVAAWVELFVTIEWTYPYCIKQDDGPAYAVFGMPFPYRQFGAVTSMQDVTTPHVYLLNAALLSLLLFPAVLWILASVGPDRKSAQRIAGVVGGFLLLSMASLQALTVYTGMQIPQASLSVYNGGYWDLRPVRFTMDAHRAAPCTPSPYWFTGKGE